MGQQEIRLHATSLSNRSLFNADALVAGWPGRQMGLHTGEGGQAAQRQQNGLDRKIAFAEKNADNSTYSNNSECSPCG
jgi:hypothetical protein